MTHTERERFYSSTAWKRKRAAALRRDGYQCRIARRYGKAVPAEIVHHIFPLEEYPQYALCDWNLISLSRTAHNRLHDRVTNALTDEGKQLARRLAVERGMKEKN